MPFISVTDQRWTSLLSETPHDFYHLPGFAQIEAELMHGEALAWYLDDGTIRHLVPCIKRPVGMKDLYDLVSPYGYPGIVSREALPVDEAGSLFNLFHKEAASEGYVSSFIRLNPISNSWNFNETTNRHDLLFEQVFHGQTVSVDLKPSLQAIRKNFSENHRRNLKKLKIQGYRLEFNNWAYLDEFIEVYRQTMTRKSAYPYYFFPSEYFDQLKKILGEHLVFVTIKDSEDQLVSGGLFTHFGKIMQYHLGATHAGALEYSPSKLMMDETIVYGKKKGAEMLHVGGGFSANTTDGLFRFKKGFGSHFHSFSTLRFIHRPEVYDKLKTNLKGRILNIGFFPAYRTH